MQSLDNRGVTTRNEESIRTREGREEQSHFLRANEEKVMAGLVSPETFNSEAVWCWQVLRMLGQMITHEENGGG